MTISAYSNDPTSIPWPVGDDLPEMYQTKTLMNSYGDPNGSWSDLKFHCGIDIDSLTAQSECEEVRCVHGEAGQEVVVSEIFSVYHRGFWEYVVVTTEGAGSQNHEDYGWCYEHLDDPSENGIYPWDVIEQGDLIASMHDSVATDHVHFKWTVSSDN